MEGMACVMAGGGDHLAPTGRAWQYSSVGETDDRLILPMKSLTKWGQAPRRLGATPHFVRSHHLRKWQARHHSKARGMVCSFSWIGRRKSTVTCSPACTGSLRVRLTSRPLSIQLARMLYR